MKLPQIHFEKANVKHQDIIFKWLAEPHMQEFWDNSQEHKDDILIFINGRKQPSNYFNGIFTYWIGHTNKNPYCLLLTAEVLTDSDMPAIWRKHLSKTGKTYSIDFGIGNTQFLGKGLASLTLTAFAEFFQTNVDTSVDTFFIDPDKSNPRAIHVYAKAGFEMMGEFEMDIGVFQGQQTYLMVKKLLPKSHCIQVTLAEKIAVEEINPDQAEILCRSITNDLPEYFGIPLANEQYFKGVRHCNNLAVKINEQYVGLLSLNFPYPNNSNIYWMGILRDHQGQGIGHRLLEEACLYAKKQYANSIMVETLSPEESDENYLRTYHFYQSAGFKPLINLKPEGYEWNMVYMVKQLDSALLDLLSLENDAKNFGFEWPNETMIIEQAMDECREIKEAVDKQEMRERIQEEIGDLLHSTISLCEFAGFEIEDTLIKVNSKFEKRMCAIKKLTYEMDLPNLKGKSIDFMMELWRKAKVIADE